MAIIKAEASEEFATCHCMIISAACSFVFFKSRTNDACNGYLAYTTT